MKSIVLLLLFFPILISAQVDVQPNPAIPVDRPDGTADGYLDFPDVEAQFPGGTAAMQQFISENVVYPEEAMNANEEGKVYMSFVVETDGSITTIQIERGASTSLDKEAVRLVSMMPNWKPGELEGKPVRTRCRLPINFTLDDPAPIQYTSAYADASTEDTKAIMEVFTAYKIAMLSDQGTEVVKYVDQNTIDYYGYILEQARHAVEGDVSDLGLVHQLSVLLIRHTATAKDLEKLDARGILAYLINNKYISNGSLEESTLSVIKSNGSIAEAYIREGEIETTQHFLFHKEQGHWRIDLTTHFDGMQRILDAYIHQSNITEKDLMVQLLEKVNGKKPDAQIWEPMVK